MCSPQLTWIHRELAQSMQIGLHYTNCIVTSRTTTAISLENSLGEKFETAARPSLEHFQIGYVQEMYSIRTSDLFVGYGIWLWDFWKSQACNELLSTHEHRNSVKNLYKVSYFLSSEDLRVLVDLKFLLGKNKNEEK